MRFEFSTMGCPCALHVEACDDATAQHAYDATLAEVDRLDRKYSHYRVDSLLAKLSSHVDAAISVDAETADLLDFATELHRQSHGLFDITAGKLTRFWDARHDRVPSQAEIDTALDVTGWQRIEWNRPNLRVTTRGMHLDFGGLVKEYAADRCAQLCRDIGVESGVVDLGGDLALIGPHENGEPWVVGIKAPRAEGKAAARIELPRGGLATSGDYERALIIDGRRYSHIVDPRSGFPIESFASVSVVAETCLVAGAASTLAMLLGVERGGTWLKELGLPHLCIDTNGAVSGDIAI
ncbi:MAG: FAD:protein FMN transferase [Rudaea sp.]